MQERRALTRKAAVRYRKTDKTGKKQIPDEFTQISYYHRKHAITLRVYEGKRQLVRVDGKALQVEIRHKSPSRRGDYLCRGRPEGPDAPVRAV